MSSGATGYDSKVWETLTHFYDAQAWIPKNVTFVNKAAFDALDKATAGSAAQGRRGRRGRAAGRSREDKAGWYVDRAQGQGHEGACRRARALQAGLKKIGEQLTADWLKKAGADGQAVVDAYKKM